MEDISDFSEFLAKLSFWEHLTACEEDLILSNLRRLHCDAGQPVLSSGVDCLGALFVKSGILRVYLLSDEGKETTMYRLRDGDVCLLSASCLLSSITFEVEIDAETDCDLLLIPTAVLSTVMKRNIYVENFSYRVITEHFSDMVAAVERMFFMSLRQRIAAFLLDESAAQRTDDLALTQDQLARAIGSAREAVSRNLKQLTACGCIELKRGSIRLLDKKKLLMEVS